MISVHVRLAGVIIIHITSLKSAFRVGHAKCAIFNFHSVPILRFFFPFFCPASHFPRAFLSHFCTFFVALFQVAAKFVCDYRIMPPKRTTPFQSPHQLQYGLQIDGHDAHKVVNSVSCKFCLFFGREVAVVVAAARKRKVTDNCKIFGPPFRPENYRHHHEAHHAVQWATYQQLDSEARKVFFDNRTNRNNTLHRYMDLEASTLTFPILASVVDDIVAVMFFYEPEDNSDDDELDADVVLNAVAQAAQKRNAMKLFVR